MSLAASPEPWSPPVTVPGSAGAGQPQVLFAPGGAAAVLWSGPPAAYAAASWGSLAGDRLAGTPTQIVAGQIFQTQIEGAGAVASGNTVLITGNDPNRASLLTGTLGASVGAPTPLATHRGLAMPIAANRGGQFALILSTTAGAQLITGRVGSMQRQATALPQANGATAAVAIDRRGDALAAWVDRHGRLFARIAPARRPATAPRMLGPAAGMVDVHAVLTDRGTAVVAWASEQVNYFLSCDCDRVASPATFRVATGSLAGSFSRTSLLASFPVRNVYIDIGANLVSFAAMSLTTVGSAQQVVLGWRQALNGALVARIASGPAFATRRDIAQAGHDVQLDGLVGGPRGELLALLTTAPSATPDGGSPSHQAQLESACAPAGLSFGAPEAITAPGVAKEPAAAFDPRTDVAVAAWAAGDPINGVLTLASRAPGC